MTSCLSSTVRRGSTCRDVSFPMSCGSELSLLSFKSKTLIRWETGRNIFAATAEYCTNYTYYLSPFKWADWLILSLKPPLMRSDFTFRVASEAMSLPLGSNDLSSLLCKMRTCGESQQEMSVQMIWHRVLLAKGTDVQLHVFCSFLLFIMPLPFSGEICKSKRHSKGPVKKSRKKYSVQTYDRVF